jgi:phage portal protein BeeE
MIRLCAKQLLMSKCLESLLESRLDFLLHQEARVMGLPEDAAIQVQPLQLE